MEPGRKHPRQGSPRPDATPRAHTRVRPCPCFKEVSRPHRKVPTQVLRKKAVVKSTVIRVRKLRFSPELATWPCVCVCVLGGCVCVKSPLSASFSSSEDKEFVP